MSHIINRLERSLNSSTLYIMHAFFRAWAMVLGYNEDYNLIIKTMIKNQVNKSRMYFACDLALDDQAPLVSGMPEKVLNDVNYTTPKGMPMA